MSRILVCKDNENLALKKHKAFQYKNIDLTSLKCGDMFSIKDEDDKLVGVVESETDNEEPIYTIVTNEFGLYAMSSGVQAKVKVSFCDNGMMIVDILEGAVLIKPAGEVLLASRGVSDLPSVDLDSILWVNADKLLSYSQYWGALKSKYTQDFEYVFVLKGGLKHNLVSFGIKLVDEEVIDISGGAIAVLEDQLQVKEEAKQVKQGFADLVKQASVSYDFDEDDEDEDEEYTDEYDDYGEDDGSDY